MLESLARALVTGHLADGAVGRDARNVGGHTLSPSFGESGQNDCFGAPGILTWRGGGGKHAPCPWENWPVMLFPLPTRRRLETASIFGIYSVDGCAVRPSSSMSGSRRGSMTRVVVGMSGGVDSSGAAAFLQGRGFGVVGLLLPPWSGPAHRD